VADAQIAAHALSTDAAIVSRDLDFADIRQYPPEKYSGLIVLRLPDDTVAMEIATVLERFLSEPRFIEQLRGRLAIVEKDRVRFRPSLEPGDFTV
jgi:predicted nuclease of predicted toxin-antitoxin system